jgi:hypothetical protein
MRDICRRRNEMIIYMLEYGRGHHQQNSGDIYHVTPCDSLETALSIARRKVGYTKWQIYNEGRVYYSDTFSEIDHSPIYLRIYPIKLQKQTDETHETK